MKLFSFFNNNYRKVIFLIIMIDSFLLEKYSKEAMVQAETSSGQF